MGQTVDPDGQREIKVIKHVKVGTKGHSKDPSYRTKLSFVDLDCIKIIVGGVIC